MCSPFKHCKYSDIQIPLSVVTVFRAAVQQNKDSGTLSHVVGHECFFFGLSVAGIMPWYGLDRPSLCPREIWILLPQPPKNCNYSCEQRSMALTSYLKTFYFHAVQSKEPDEKLASLTLPFKSLRQNWLILSMSYSFVWWSVRKLCILRCFPEAPLG